ncbi:MAG: hypothetical protein EOO11_12285 [Chitinophagaceae bacterium]|nr:MAG: hypothetical protein EOO11_12285 [Chitinophagaceae bacterium]
MPPLADPYSAYFLVYHPYRDVPRGTRFCTLMPAKDPALAVPVDVTLEWVSVRRSSTDDEVPCGYSAMCALRFYGPMPDIFHTLPAFGIRGSRPFGLLLLLTNGLAAAIHQRLSEAC